MSKGLTLLEAFQLFCKELKIGDSDFAKAIEKALIDKEQDQKKLKAFDVIKRLLYEDCVSDLLHILHKYNKWEDYDYACDYNDENPILKLKEEFDLLKRYCYDIYA